MGYRMKVRRFAFLFCSATFFITAQFFSLGVGVFRFWNDLPSSIIVKFLCGMANLYNTKSFYSGNICGVLLVVSSARRATWASTPLDNKVMWKLIQKWILSMWYHFNIWDDDNSRQKWNLSRLLYNQRRNSDASLRLKNWHHLNSNCFGANIQGFGWGDKVTLKSMPRNLCLQLIFHMQQLKIKFIQSYALKLMWNIIFCYKRNEF